VTEIECVEICERRECGGNGAGEAVVREGDDTEVGELSELRWDGTSDDAGGENELG